MLRLGTAAIRGGAAGAAGAAGAGAAGTATVARAGAAVARTGAGAGAGAAASAATAGNTGLRKFVADALESEVQNIVGEVLDSRDMGRDPTPGGTFASVVHKIVVATIQPTHTPAECHLALRTAGVDPTAAVWVMAGGVPDSGTALRIASRAPASEQARTRHVLIEAHRRKWEAEKAAEVAKAKEQDSRNKLAELEAEIEELNRKIYNRP